MWRPNWWGILAPAGTPQPIVDKLHDAIEEILKSADTKKFLDQQGAAPVQMSSAEFGKLHRTAGRSPKWGTGRSKKAGMKAE